MTRENQIEARVSEYAESLGFYCYKLKGTGKRGKFDRIFIYGMFCCLVEFKKPREGRLSIHQIIKLNEYEKQGTPAQIISSFELGCLFFDKMKALFDNTN